MLKITSYGLYAFKHKELGKTELGEYEKFRSMLWSAPEILRLQDFHRPRYGTPKGDVYSFAIVLYEIIFRTMPFDGENMSPRGEFIYTKMFET